TARDVARERESAASLRRCSTFPLLDQRAGNAFSEDFASLPLAAITASLGTKRPPQKKLCGGLRSVRARRGIRCARATGRRRCSPYGRTRRRSGAVRPP